MLQSLSHTKAIAISLIPFSFLKRTAQMTLRRVYVHTTSNRWRAKVIDGVKIAKAFRAELWKEVEKWVAQGHRCPQLTAVCVGNDPASSLYIRNKVIAAKEVGIQSKILKYATKVTEEELLDTLESLNEDPGVDGILVQLPLPDHISERTLCNAVDPKKDVDGFSAVNVGRFCLNMEAFIPCTALAVQQLLSRTGIETRGKHAVVCGRSKNVGLPIAMLLHADGTGKTGAMDATTTICHRNTPPDELAFITRSADIIISATGVPNLIKPAMVKKGACVIDVGITRIIDSAGKKSLVGDVDFEGVSEIAGYITPVPGGVGPITVSILMRNTLIAAKKVVAWKERKS